MNKSEQGKKNRASGARFELSVRKVLEYQGFIVDKWTNNVDLDKGKLIPAKSNRFRMRSGGFPDFIVYKLDTGLLKPTLLVGVEVKSNGYLDPTERKKMQWLLKNKVFDAVGVYSKKDEFTEIKLKESEGRAP